MSDHQMTPDQRRMRERQKQIERRLRLLELRVGIFHPTSKFQLTDRTGR